MSKAMLVLAPQERAHQITPFERSNATTTRAAVTVADPAATLRVGYSNLGSAAGKVLYVVINATSDADANAKLALAGQRFTIPIGESREFQFGPEALLTRIDTKSDIATETGASLVTGEYGVVL